MAGSQTAWQETPSLDRIARVAIPPPIVAGYHE